MSGFCVTYIINNYNIAINFNGMKIVINTCVGGFELSATANKWFTDNYPNVDPVIFYCDAERTHPALIECVEALGTSRASPQDSKLVVVEFPGDKYLLIENDMGYESVYHPECDSWSINKYK